LSGDSDDEVFSFFGTLGLNLNDDVSVNETKAEQAGSSAIIPTLNLKAQPDRIVQIVNSGIQLRECSHRALILWP